MGQERYRLRCYRRPDDYAIIRATTTANRAEAEKEASVAKGMAWASTEERAAWFMLQPDNNSQKPDLRTAFLLVKETVAAELDCGPLSLA